MPAVLLWTLVGPGASYAWYGGRLVRPGDEIEGGRVHAIAEDHIVLLIGRRRERVPLIAPAPPARPHNPCPPDGRETCASSPAPESKP
ncbi:MAG: hypothetical protein RMK60_07225 [Burkholderiales bacterium]|nr:hypothetical protein [Burkholderiales bacterium]